MDGGRDLRMAAAAANQALERTRHLFRGGVWVLVKKRFGGQNPAVQAIAALEGLRLDERRLDRVGMLGGAETLQGDDFFSVCAGDRKHARSHGNLVKKHGARAALAESATEARIIEAGVVAENIEERALGIDINLMRLAVYLE